MSNIFGTDGIREKIHQGCLSEKNLIKLGHAIGTWANENFQKPTRILLGHDTRSSCSIIIDHLLESLLQYNVTIFDGKTLPTPVVCKLVQEEDFDLGIIISASHNLADYNGIKLVKKHAKASNLAESAITHHYLHDPIINKPETGSIQSYDQATQLYQILITAWFDTEFLENKTIVLDCAHGATYKLAPKIFEVMGAKVITINDHPDGHNINLQCGSTQPQNLQQAVLKHKADWGIAFDGDGDRCLIVDTTGKIYNGDDMLATLAYHPRLETKQVVGTIMSNHGLANYFEQQDKIFRRAAVGDKQVHHMMQQHDIVLGGEPSGHIIVKPFSYSGDGIFTSLLFLDTLIRYKKNLPEWTKYAQTTCNLQVTHKPSLEEIPFKEIIAKYDDEVIPGRTIVRYSGTEPLLRVTVEHEDAEKAYDIAQKLYCELEFEIERYKC